MSRTNPFLSVRALPLALCLGVVPATAQAATTEIELSGAVGLISPLEPGVDVALANLGVIQEAPVTASIVWERQTPGFVDPGTGKTEYDFAVVDFTVEIGDYMITHGLGMPIDDQNIAIVGDDKEPIATPGLADSILVFAGGIESEEVIGLPAPADEGVNVVFAFQGATDVLTDQSLVVDQEMLDLILEDGETDFEKGIQMQIGTTRGILRIGFDDAVLVPEPAPTLLLAMGAGVLVACGRSGRNPGARGPAGTKRSRAPAPR